MSNTKELGLEFLVIKVSSLYYASFVLGIGGILVSVINEKFIIGKYFNNDENESKSIHMLVLELLFIIGTLNVMAYFGRNVLQHIPFPLDNQFGFKYSRLKELSSGTIFTVILLFTCKTFTEKLQVLVKRLNAIKID
jgi:hypothetical protein